MQVAHDVYVQCGIQSIYVYEQWNAEWEEQRAKGESRYRLLLSKMNTQEQAALLMRCAAGMVEVCWCCMLFTCTSSKSVEVSNQKSLMDVSVLQRCVIGHDLVDLMQVQHLQVVTQAAASGN